MEMTSAQAAKLLKQLQEERTALLEKETISATFVAAMGEDAESVRPAYDYTQTQKDLSLLEKKIRSIKHALNVFNASTVVPGFDMTVDELLVYLPQLNARTAKLASMKARLPKMRVEAPYGKTSNIIDYTYVNYDLEETERDYAEARQELTRAQLALDSVNNEKTFQIDL